MPQALVELRRAADTQLDREVVEELSAVVRQQAEQFAPTGARGYRHGLGPPALAQASVLARVGVPGDTRLSGIEGPRHPGRCRILFRDRVGGLLRLRPEPAGAIKRRQGEV
jgi:hypothetical protein